MKDYLVTERAGAEVAGIRNPGINETVHLTDLAAEHPLRLGHIVPVAERTVESEASQASPVPRKRGRGRRK
jgi:hypothetical protein